MQTRLVLLVLLVAGVIAAGFVAYAATTHDQTEAQAVRPPPACLLRYTPGPSETIRVEPLGFDSAAHVALEHVAPGGDVLLNATLLPGEDASLNATPLRGFLRASCWHEGERAEAWAFVGNQTVATGSTPDTVFTNMTRRLP